MYTERAIVAAERMTEGLSWPEAFLGSVVAICIVAFFWLLLR